MWTCLTRTLDSIYLVKQFDDSNSKVNFLGSDDSSPKFVVLLRGKHLSTVLKNHSGVVRCGQYNVRSDRS